MRSCIWIIFLSALIFVPVGATAKVGLPSSVMDRGGLYFPGDDSGTVVSAPLVKTDITVDVSGPIARYRLRHTLVNNSEAWTEAIYTYPLPSDSAVDRLYMQIGDRRIVGKIAEKEEARRQYNEARSAGQRVSLVEQHRPNIFSTSLANIGPGEHIAVEIGFQDHLTMNDGAFRLRMPLVVGPRYVSHQEIDGFHQSGWSANAGNVSELEKITPPLRSAEQGPGHPVHLQVRLDAGFPLSSISSPSHGIETETTATGVIRISLKNTVPADRDFTLVWHADNTSVPSAGLFSENVDGERYALLMLTPPLSQDTDIEMARDITFIVDTSGSMEGTSIDQAKAALRLALDRLTPKDRFQIVRFSSDNSAFRNDMVPATASNVSDAKNFVTSLAAEGGTEIISAVAAALSTRVNPTRLSQVVLITDGAVSSEQNLFQVIKNRSGLRRFFTVGIGSAPNGYLMTRAAEVGRGSYTYIQNLDEVAAQMNDLFAKLEKPALVDARVVWNGDSEPVEMWPIKMPDLYFGEPMTILAKLPKGVDSANISGRVGDDVWSSTIHLKGGQARPGVATLWGRKKIKALMQQLGLMETHDVVKQRIVETALKFQLLSRYTSLVAVDDQIARPQDRELASMQVPTNLPDGWSREAIEGTVPNSQPIQKTRMFDRGDPMLQRTMSSSVSKLSGIPQTATNAPLILLIGMFVTILAVVVTLLGWFRRDCHA